MKKILLCFLILMIIIIVVSGCSPNKNPRPSVSSGAASGTNASPPQNIRTANPSATLKYVPSPMPTF